jgi:hypothetical protein
MDLKSLVGLTEEEAISIIEEFQYSHRIVSKNGNENFITMDLRLNRCNLTIVDNIVTNVTMG